MTSAEAQAPPSSKPENNRKMTDARTRAHSSNRSVASLRDHGNQDYSRSQAGAALAGNCAARGFVQLGANPAGFLVRSRRPGAASASRGDSVFAVAERRTGQVARL